MMEKFWHKEEPKVASLLFTEDGWCEEVYQSRHDLRSDHHITTYSNEQILNELP